MRSRTETRRRCTYLLMKLRTTKICFEGGERTSWRDITMVATHRSDLRRVTVKGTGPICLFSGRRRGLPQHHCSRTGGEVKCYSEPHNIPMRNPISWPDNLISKSSSKALWRRRLYWISSVSRHEALGVITHPAGHIVQQSWGRYLSSNPRLESRYHKRVNIITVLQYMRRHG